MQLQDQVISLEQAKKLKEFWFLRDSIHRHIKYMGTERIQSIWNLSISPVFEYSYPAYTASELMDILPEYVKRLKLSIERIDWEYTIMYTDEDWMVQICSCKNNFAIALWDMLIYLLENNLLPNQDK